jgi:hypothetical protein
MSQILSLHIQIQTQTKQKFQVQCICVLLSLCRCGYHSCALYLYIEFYSYSEEEDFQKNHLCFVEDRERQGFSTDNDNWKKSYVQSLLDKLELTNESHRVQSARSLLYLMQGVS